MEDRLKRLLAMVVESVIETGEPVGSQHLVDAYRLDVSPATVRNWFSELETGGWIAQPHTSAGRVPTEKGYALYVDELMKPKTIGKRERGELEKATDASNDAALRMKTFAKKAADLADNAVVVGLGEADTFYTGLSRLFGQPEFREWNRIVSLGEVLDRLDDVLHGLRKRRFEEPTPLIGTRCPFGNACGSIALTLPGGEFIGILGPLRMDYAGGIALLDTAKELLA